MFHFQNRTIKFKTAAFQKRRRNKINLHYGNWLKYSDLSEDGLTYKVILLTKSTTCSTRSAFSQQHTLSVNSRVWGRTWGQTRGGTLGRTWGQNWRWNWGRIRDQTWGWISGQTWVPIRGWILGQIRGQTWGRTWAWISCWAWGWTVGRIECLTWRWMRDLTLAWIGADI